MTTQLYAIPIRLRLQGDFMCDLLVQAQPVVRRSLSRSASSLGPVLAAARRQQPGAGLTDRAAAAEAQNSRAKLAEVVATQTCARHAKVTTSSASKAAPAPTAQSQPVARQEHAQLLAADTTSRGQAETSVATAPRQGTGLSGNWRFPAAPEQTQARPAPADALPYVEQVKSHAASQVAAQHATSHSEARASSDASISHVQVCQCAVRAPHLGLTSACQCCR